MNGTTPPPPIFFSLFCYPLSKEAQAKGTSEQRLVQLQIELGPKAKWPGFRTLYWLRTLGEVALHLDCSTLIAKARSAAAAQFLKSPCDVWISCDDDSEADAGALGLLIAATRAHELVVAPQMNSDARTVNVHFDRDPPLGYELSNTIFEPHAGPALGSRLAPITFGGCSLMGASRHAIEAMAEGFPELVCPVTEHQERPLLALFLEQVIRGEWIGEDACFFRRARNVGLVPKVLLDCGTRHAGMTLPATWFDQLCRPGADLGDGR